MEQIQPGAPTLADVVHARLWRSTDNGATWTEITPIQTPGNLWGDQSSITHSLGLAFNRIVEGTEGQIIEGLAASVNAPGDFIQLTTNGGATYTKVVPDSLYNAGAPDNDTWDIRWFVALNNLEVWALGAFYLKSVLHTILKSTNNAGSFATTVTDPTPGVGTLYRLNGAAYLGGDTVVVCGRRSAGPLGTTFRTTNRGTTWTEVVPVATLHASTLQALFAVALFPGTTILLCGGNQSGGGVDGIVLYRSTDGGASYTDNSDAIRSLLTTPNTQSGINRIVPIDNLRALVGIEGDAAIIGSPTLWFLTENAGVTFTAVTMGTALTAGFNSTRQLQLADDGSISAFVTRAGTVGPELWRGVPSGFTAAGPCKTMTPTPPAVTCPFVAGNAFPTADTNHLDFGQVAVGSFKTLTLTVTNHSPLEQKGTLTIT